MLLKILIFTVGPFESPYGIILSISKMVTINKEGSAGEGSTGWKLITHPALFKSSVSHLSGIKYQFYLISHFQSIAAWSVTHCALLVCSSALCPSPCKCNTHTGLWDVQDPTILRVDVTAIADGWVSRFLKFPVHTSNRVTNSSWTGTSAQTILGVSLSHLIFATALWESYYPHFNFQTKTLKHNGLPNLKSPWLAGSWTCI